MAYKEYDLTTAGNACKMNTIAKSLTEFDFSKCQIMVDYAKDHQMAFRGHNTCWANTGKPHYQPKFIIDETNSTIISNFLENYITTTVGHFTPKPFAWDVVNEAISGKTGEDIRDSVWNKVDDFICKAFTWAHNADPDAKLFYNDFNHASSTTQKVKSDQVYKLVKDLTDRGCNIHGVGFQLHVDIDYSAAIPGVVENMKRYEAIGIDVHMTEIDIKCRLKEDKTCVEWTDETLALQTKAYEGLLRACLEAKNCKSFETWGFTDKYSWLRETPNMNGLPFDKDFQKKGAYTGMLNLLKSFPRTHEAVVARNEEDRAAI